MIAKGKTRRGRPTLDGEVGGGESKRVSVRLTDAQIAAAEGLGDGSISIGVRLALDRVKKATAHKKKAMD